MFRKTCCGLAFIFLLFVFLSVFLSAATAQATLVGTASQATLNITPGTVSFSPGENFALSIYLNSSSQNVVAVAAYLNYDKSFFQALSIDTAGSAFTMEAEKAIDPTNGVVRIALGKPTPGVNTASGLVARINFKALSETSPSSDNFNFDFAAGDATESAAIKDDGLGTNILSGVYNGKYSITTGPVQGDVTGDGKVDIMDLSSVGSRFGLKSSDAGWNPPLDVVQNGEIDIYDLVFVASRFS